MPRRHNLPLLAVPDSDPVARLCAVLNRLPPMYRDEIQKRAMQEPAGTARNDWMRDTAEDLEAWLDAKTAGREHPPNGDDPTWPGRNPT